MIGIVQGIIKKIGTNYLYISENDSTDLLKVAVNDIKKRGFQKEQFVILNVIGTASSKSGKYSNIETCDLAEMENANSYVNKQKISLRDKNFSINVDNSECYPSITIEVENENNPSVRVEYDTEKKQVNATVWKDDWGEPDYHEKLC